MCIRDRYDIQIEFGDIGNILAYLSIGDRPQEVERLVSALAEIKSRYQTDGSGLLSQEYIDPVVAASPQEAIYAPKKSLPLRETDFPRPGQILPAPGRNVTTGAKERNRCHVSDKKGNMYSLDGFSRSINSPLFAENSGRKLNSPLS